MEYIESYKSTNQKEIDEVEKLLNISLPDEYSKFLLSANGGLPKKPVFSFYDKDEGRSELAMINRFLGINNGEYNNFVNYFRTYERRIPRGFIPIASDPGGNLICLSENGSVYFWNHNYEFEGDESTDYRNVYLISDSFEKFLKSLKTHEQI